VYSVHTCAAGAAAASRCYAGLVSTLRYDHSPRSWETRQVIPWRRRATQVAWRLRLRRGALVWLGLPRRVHPIKIQQVIAVVAVFSSYLTLNNIVSLKCYLTWLLWAIISFENVRWLVCMDCVLVLELSAYAAVTVTCSCRPTSSSSTIIARPTPRRRRPTTTLTPPTSTRGVVISNWWQRLRRRRCWTTRLACMPGRTSRQCSTEAVDDAFTIIINTSAFLSVCLIHYKRLDSNINTSNDLGWFLTSISRSRRYYKWFRPIVCASDVRSVCFGS